MRLACYEMDRDNIADMWEVVKIKSTTIFKSVYALHMGFVQSDDVTIP